MVFDEFRGKFPLQYILVLLSHAPLNYEKIKNIRQRSIKAFTFVFTSNRHPDTYYDDDAWRGRVNESWFHSWEINSRMDLDSPTDFYERMSAASPTTRDLINRGVASTDEDEEGVADE